MKKIRLLFMLLILFSFNSKYKADTCSDKELVSLVKNMKVEYKLDEFGEKEVTFDTINDNGENVKEKMTVTNNKDYFYVLLLKTNKYVDLNIKVTDDYEDSEYDASYNYYYENYIIGSPLHFDSKTYNIKIYAGESTSCNGELLREISYKVPPYNKYVNTEYCNQNPDDEEICALDKDTSKITIKDFKEKTSIIEEKREFNNKSFIQKVWFYIKNYYLYVLIPLVIVTMGYVIMVIKYKRKALEV